MSTDIQERKKKVQLLAVNQKYRSGTPFFLVPVYDRKNNKMLFGWEKESQVNIGKFLRALLPPGQSDADALMVPIHHGQSLNLEDNSAFATYLLAKNSDMIADSRKLIDAQLHVFYINDVEAESMAELTFERRLNKAKTLIFDSPPEKLKSLAIDLGGVDVRSLSVNNMTTRLLKEADSRVDAIIQYFAKPDTASTFVKELAYYGVIRQDKGVYYDGDIYMGTLSDAINFVNNPDKSEAANSLGKRLTEAKQV